MSEQTCPAHGKIDGLPTIGAVTAAKARKLPSIVHGETGPYEWAVYEGATPLKRFIDKTAALDYFLRLVEEKQVNNE